MITLKLSESEIKKLLASYYNEHNFEMVFEEIILTKILKTKEGNKIKELIY